MLKQLIEDVSDACDDGLVDYDDDSDSLYGELTKMYTPDVADSIMLNDCIVALPVGFFMAYRPEDSDDDEPIWLKIAAPLEDNSFRWITSALNYVEGYTKDEIDEALHQATMFYKPNQRIMD